MAEGIGTFFLLAAIVGPGIMAHRLAGGSDALALLANAVATGAALFVFISAFQTLSGAHFNPAVTLSLPGQKVITSGDAGLYILVQILAGLCGVLAAHTSCLTCP